MKTRIMALLLSIVTLFSFAVIPTGVYAAEKVVYVAEGGSGDGTSDASPFGSLEDAYNALGDEGGKIVICGDFEIKANFIEPAHTGVVTVTQKHGDKDYGADAKSMYVKSGKRYALNGPTVFEYINFKGDTSVSLSFILFVAQYNPITFGDGVNCTDFAFSQVANSVTVLGGYQTGFDKEVGGEDDKDSHITVKSGRFTVVAFNRQSGRKATGCAHIDISGGTFANMYLGSANNGMGGGAVVNISGGKFEGNIYLATTGANYTTGDVKLNIAGGDFSACPSIAGTPSDGYTSEADISQYKGGDITSKLSGFSKLITSEGEKTQKTINDFASGSFTDSKGTTIPYRYYLPKDYSAEKKYPVLLYMHGNGSRGSDNKTQLTTNGAALMVKIFENYDDVIIIAPQCASSSAWVADSRYPGSASFNETTEMSPYLNAAKELFDKFLADYSVDTSRLYITGSSNGGAASWELTYRFPNLFAAAAPLAGTGSGDGAVDFGREIAKVGTRFWTFHGDKDTTLSIKGTQKIYEMSKEAGGSNINFTVISGGSHDIWSKVAAGTYGDVPAWMFSVVNGNYSPAERSYGKEPAVTEPPVTEPVVTEAPVTEPPVTEPPVTEPPVTEPPVTEPPVTEPPVTEPLVTDPPVTEPPVTEPALTGPATTLPAPDTTEAPDTTVSPDTTVTPEKDDPTLTMAPDTTQTPDKADTAVTTAPATDAPSESSGCNGYIASFGYISFALAAAFLFARKRED